MSLILVKRVHKLFLEMINSNLRPLVSVIMPVYNCGKYLHPAIDSILVQTYTNFELLIITSTSATPEDFKSIRFYNDQRIRHIQHDHGAGIVPSLLAGIEQAKGKYIARMDGDDVSFPERLEKQVEFLENHPGIGVLGSWARKINETNEFIGNMTLPIQHADIAWTMAFTNPMAHPTIMIRKQVLLENNYSTEFLSEDYWLWCRLIFQTKFENLPETLINYRFHRASSTNVLLPYVITGGFEIRMRYWQNFINIQRKTFSELATALEGRPVSFLVLIRTLLALRKFRQAFQKRFHLFVGEAKKINVRYRQKIRSTIRWYLKRKLK